MDQYKVQFTLSELRNHWEVLSRGDILFDLSKFDIFSIRVG